MKKGNFSIVLDNNTMSEVEGYISKEFGIYKGEHGNYIVTHLKNGMKILSFLKLKHAKKFVGLIEETEFPIPFKDVTLEGCMNGTIEIWKNASLIMDLAKEAKNNS